MRELSILIPARQEEFLARTIQDILEHREADTEIIVTLDGAWPKPAVPQDDRVNMIYVAEPIGQRATINRACEASTARYVMKCDAHCSFDQGFDRKMLEAYEKVDDNVTMVPIMRNLYCFDWVCECGFTHYQDKGSQCPKCKKTMTKKMVWKPRSGTRNYSYCFDSTPHFQYFKQYNRTKKFNKDLEATGLTETMSLQGSSFMMSREKYWELNIGDEKFGSWGSQGLQVACSTWLSGGRVLVNHKTAYAHMFRTKPVTDFGFPYPQSGRQVRDAKLMAHKVMHENSWPHQIRPLSWLLDRFNPPGWSEKELEIVKKEGEEFYKKKR